MSIVGAAVLCIIVSLVCKIIEPSCKSVAMVLAVALVGFVMFLAVSGLSDITACISRLAGKAQIEQDYIKIIFKSMGICYISSIACSCCKDCGEHAVASAVETLAKISLAVLSLPLLNAVISIVEALIYE